MIEELLKSEQSESFILYKDKIVILNKDNIILKEININKVDKEIIDDFIICTGIDQCIIPTTQFIRYQLFKVEDNKLLFNKKRLHK